MPDYEPPEVERRDYRYTITDTALEDDIDIPKEKVRTLARDVDFINQLEVFCNGISNVFAVPEYQEIIGT